MWPQQRLKLEANGTDAIDMKKPGSYHRVHTEGSLHVFPYDFGVTEISRLVFSWDNGFPVAKFIYARILFYEDNRSQFSWFLFAQFGLDRSHFEVVRR